MLPADENIVKAQKTVRHTGTRVVVSESIEDEVLSRELDHGSHDVENV